MTKESYKGNELLKEIDELKLQLEATREKLRNKEEALLHSTHISNKNLHHQTNSEYNTIIHTSLDGFCIHNKDGKILEVNKAFCHMLGYSTEELTSMNLKDFQCIKPIDEIDSHIAQMINTSGDLFENQLRHKDGRAIDVEIQVQYIKKLGDYFYTFIRDISKRKQLEKVINENSIRMNALMNTIPDLIWLKDKDGIYLSCNKMFGRFFGAEEKDIIGKTDDDFVDKVQADYFRENDILAMVADIPNVNEELVRFADDGHEELLETIKTPMHDINGSLIGILGIGRDITNRKHTETHLLKTLESLNNAYQTTIEVLTRAVELRDPYTAGHQKRVSTLAMAIAQELKLSPETVQGIKLAGSIHDIGKISTPSEILSTPRVLTDIEFSLVKEHSRLGYELLRGVESPWKLCDMIHQHHERINGSGYPKGLIGNNILIEARILCVADVVDAMNSHRPYRPSLGIDAALYEIEKNIGILYDTDVVTACIKLFRELNFKFDEN